MGDPIRVGDLLAGDPASEQRARTRFDQRLETLAAFDETLSHRVIDFAAWAATVLGGYPAVAAWVACGYASSVLRRVHGRSALSSESSSRARDV